MTVTKDWVLVTCEHGGNRVPARYARLFVGRERTLGSHRGFDTGALDVARDMARVLCAPLVASTVTRLLVDLNRSVGHRDLRSTASRRSSPAEQDRMLRDHYFPYRRRVERLVARAVGRGLRVVHLSSHTFTPTLNGEVRRADVGLLYDPTRAGERALCGRWLAALGRLAPHLQVRRNYPYRGKNDGLTSHLRRRHAPEVYVGVELEINQALIRAAGRRWTRLRATVIESLRAALAPIPERMSCSSTSVTS